MELIERLLADKSPDNIAALYEAVRNYRDWPNGVEFNWPSHFLADVETFWMRQEDFIENM